MINIAVFASGSGTNAENLARIFNNGSRAKISLVLCNRRKAGVFERMAPLGVESIFVENKIWDDEPEKIVEILKAHNINLIVLAGFMHFVSPVIIDAFKGRIINIHPSLLPDFGGVGMYGHHVHEAVIKAGVRQSGVTVHYVTEEIDGGEIVMQQTVDITDEDTPESLEAKIHPVEYDLYPRAVMKVVEQIEQNSPQSPPPVDQAWADRLKIKYQPSEKNTKNESPETPPAIPQSPASTSHSSITLPPPGVKNNSHSSQMMNPDEVIPPNYLVWAVLSTLCCCFIPGIVAIIFSSKVNSRWYAGDHDGARRASKQAEIWIIVSFCLGVLAASFSIPLQLFQQAIGL